VLLSLGDGQDTGSGVDGNGESLERAEAPLAGGACGTFGGYVAIIDVPVFDFVDLSVASGRCYKYRFVVPDRVANRAIFTSGSIVKVDADAPAVSLANPGSTVSGTVGLSATATDAGGSGLSDVRFERAPAGTGSWTLIGTSTSAPYSASWDTTALANGNYDLRAVARDGAGGTTNSEVVTVAVQNGAPADTTPPSVALTAPAEGATVSGTTTISADASDNVAVARVDFVVDNKVVGTDTSSPYSVAWDSTKVSDGTVTLRARATDTSNNTTVSAKRSVTVENSNPPIDTTPPTVALTAPADGATVSGSTTISATASDNVAVAQVQFLVNGNVVGTDAIAPYSVSWDSTTVPNGSATLSARAADLAGNSATSATRSVTVANGGPPPTDTTPPTVSLTAPAGGATVSGTTTISADASDNVAVAQVDFLVNGNVVGTDTSSPYSVAWDSRTVSNGTATLSARATDTSNNSAMSATRSVTVDNGDTTPPSVSLADPGAELRGTKTLSATASDAGGVARVVFQISPMGQNSWSTIATVTAVPYTAEFATTSVADGNYDFRAVATDNAGNSANSVVAGRTIDNTGASGSITSPTSGSVVSGTTNVAATASDAGSGVSQITFERSPAGQNAWAAIAAADTTVPYSTAWATNGVADGSYDIRGVILDDAGNQSTTGVVTVEVRNRHTFVPVADAYVNSERASTNYGSLTNLRVDDSPLMRSYVRFDVQVPAPIVRATLRLYTLSSATTGYDVRGVADNAWGETTISFSNGPAVSSTVTGASGAFGTGVWTEINVTPLVSSPGLVSFGLTTPSSTSQSFSSREAGATAPQLVVETG